MPAFRELQKECGGRHDHSIAHWSGSAGERKRALRPQWEEESRSYTLVEDVYDFGRESPPRPRFAGLSELIYYDAAQCRALDANSVRLYVS
jgi:hypothetical protein